MAKAKASTSTELVPIGNGDGSGAQMIQLVLDLEKAGALTKVSLDLSDEKMPIERWLALGRFLGDIDGASRWWIGDWLNFGESLYGEDSAQGTDDLHSRYDEAQRITGLDHGTLMNIRSVCGRIPKERRRAEVKFWIHAEVAALEPADQVKWLQRAIDESLNRVQLRAAIRGVPATEPEPEPGKSDGKKLSIHEQIEAAARLVWTQAQRTTDGSYLVPPEPMVQLGAAIGEGE